MCIRDSVIGDRVAVLNGDEAAGLHPAGEFLVAEGVEHKLRILSFFDFADVRLGDGNGECFRIWVADHGNGRFRLCLRARRRVEGENNAVCACVKVRIILNGL